MFCKFELVQTKKQHNQGFGNRSSCLQMFFKIGVLKILQYSQGNTCVAVSNTHVLQNRCFKIFAIFTGKHMCCSLQHTCFHGMHLPLPVFFGGRAKIFRIVFAGGVQNFYFVGGVT